jgi:hypothetical protein
LSSFLADRKALLRLVLAGHAESIAPSCPVGY